MPGSSSVASPASTSLAEGAGRFRAAAAAATRTTGSVDCAAARTISCPAAPSSRLAAYAAFEANMGSSPATSASQVRQGLGTQLRRSFVVGLLRVEHAAHIFHRNGHRELLEVLSKGAVQHRGDLGAGKIRVVGW